MATNQWTTVCSDATRRLVPGLLAGAVGVLAVAAPAQAMSGGEPVAGPDSAPWVATLALRGEAPLLQRAGCGGALVAPDRVVTAAHCVDRLDPSQLVVHLNAWVLSREPGQVRGVRGISVLPGYRILPSPVAPENPNLASARNDLAVILLDGPVPGVHPLRIAERRPEPGAPVSLYAHGTTGKPGLDRFRNDVLHRGDLVAQPAETCRGATPATVDGRSVSCARDEQGRSTTGCFLDSGSPAVRMVGGVPRLVGLFSFGGETAGLNCGAPFPMYFADVTAFRRWIHQPSPVLQPYPASPVRVGGTPSVGGQVRCQAPTWSLTRGLPPTRVEYQWATVVQQGPFPVPAPIVGADRPKLVLGPDLAGKRLACLVTAGNAGGVARAMSGPVTVGG